MFRKRRVEDSPVLHYLLSKGLHTPAFKGLYKGLKCNSALWLVLLNIIKSSYNTILVHMISLSENKSDHPDRQFFSFEVGCFFFLF